MYIGSQCGESAEACESVSINVCQPVVIQEPGSCVSNVRLWHISKLEQLTV